jgi:putative protease
MAQEEKKTPVGKVTHFFSKIGVAVVELTGTLRVGDEILVEGKQTSFRQKVESMQIEHQNITIAEAGKSVGLKLNDRARDGDVVFIVS